MSVEILQSPTDLPRELLEAMSMQDLRKLRVWAEKHRPEMLREIDPVLKDKILMIAGADGDY